MLQVTPAPTGVDSTVLRVFDGNRITSQRSQNGSVKYETGAAGATLVHCCPHLQRVCHGHVYHLEPLAGFLGFGVCLKPSQQQRRRGRGGKSAALMTFMRQARRKLAAVFPRESGEPVCSAGDQRHGTDFCTASNTSESCLRCAKD